MNTIYAAVKCRAEVRGDKIGGYAAVFNQVTDLGWEGKEQIDRAAFRNVLRDKNTDVRALWNHDPQYLLGRQSVGTLRLSVDSTGLEYEVDLPDTSYARDVRALAERGDLDGASFAFVPGEYTWDENKQIRTHTNVARLVDVAPVTFPAYGAATTEARSLNNRRYLRSEIIRARHLAARRAGRNAR